MARKNIKFNIGDEVQVSNDSSPNYKKKGYVSGFDGGAHCEVTLEDSPIPIYIAHYSLTHQTPFRIGEYIEIIEDYYPVKTGEVYRINGIQNSYLEITHNYNDIVCPMSYAVSADDPTQTHLRFKVGDVCEIIQDTGKHGFATNTEVVINMIVDGHYRVISLDLMSEDAGRAAYVNDKDLVLSESEQMLKSNLGGKTPDPIWQESIHNTSPFAGMHKPPAPVYYRMETNFPTEEEKVGDYKMAQRKRRKSRK